MEKRLNAMIEKHTIKFKDNLRNKIREIGFTNENEKLNDLLEYIYDYDRLTFSKDDFIKRKRVKNLIPVVNRCIAKRANNEQCTRRKKPDCEYCGTHYKGTPHGSVNSNINIDNDSELFIALKSKKMIKSIPTLLFYNNKVKRDSWYIPDDSVIGGDINQVYAFFDRCNMTTKKF